MMSLESASTGAPFLGSDGGRPPTSQKRAQISDLMAQKLDKAPMVATMDGNMLKELLTALGDDLSRQVITCLLNPSRDLINPQGSKLDDYGQKNAYLEKVIRVMAQRTDPEVLLPSQATHFSHSFDRLPS